jgi:hypothetical protein
VYGAGWREREGGRKWEEVPASTREARNTSAGWRVATLTVRRSIIPIFIFLWNDRSVAHCLCPSENCSDIPPAQETDCNRIDFTVFGVQQFLDTDLDSDIEIHHPLRNRERLAPMEAISTGRSFGWLATFGSP